MFCSRKALSFLFDVSEMPVETNFLDLPVEMNSIEMFWINCTAYCITVEVEILREEERGVG